MNATSEKSNQILMSEKCLIVYYSKTGNTKTVAEAISKKMHSDICMVNEQGVAQSGIEPSSYELVVVGTPVNGFGVSLPIQSYLNKNKDKFSNYAIFATYSLWPAGTLSGMEKLVGKKPVASTTFKAKEIKLGQIDRKIDEFISALKK